LIQRYSTRNARTDNSFELSTATKEAADVAYALHDADLRGNTQAVITIETAEVERWNDVKNRIEDLYTFLTGRMLKVTFSRSASGKQTTQRLQWAIAPRTVSLFSGGLDSGTFAYTLSRNHEDSVLSHTKTSLRLYGLARDFWLKYAHDGPTMFVTEHERTEPETGIANTRGIVFLTNAISIAYELGAPTVVVPENGPLMVNPPASRALEATKTANPDMIQTWSEILNQVFESKIQPDTPFRQSTKAEVILKIDSTDAIAATYSCFSSQGQEAMCGLCFACFVRMLACLAAEREENIGRQYIHHPLSDDMNNYKDRNSEKATYLLQALTFWFGLIHPELEEVIPERLRFEQVVSEPVLRRHAVDMFLGFDTYTRNHGNTGGQVGRFAEGLLRKIDPSVLSERREELRALDKG
jgi:7-cyano-7-deazaguanine synthase in queuosine biosynthesis